MTSGVAPIGRKGVAAQGRDAPEVARFRRLQLVLSGAAWTLLAGLLSLGVGAWNLRLWQADLRVPLFGSGGDTNLTTAIVKGLIEHSWVWSNPNLGAPDGVDLFDYPSAFGDTLSLAVMKLMGLASDDPILVVNAFYLLGFPLAAVAAFWVMRSLGIGSWVALVCSLLFAVLPAHFTRGIAHLGLSTYWAVPLGAWLVLGAAGLHTFFARRAGASGLLAWASRRSATTVLLVVLVGLSGLYYALFAAALMVLVGVVYYLANRRRVVLQTFFTAALLFGVVFAQQLPALLYARENGRNEAVATRTPAESETYGLKLTQVLLPSANHRVEPLAALGREYELSTPAGEGSNSYLGTLLGLALILAVVWALVAAAGGGARAGPYKKLALASGVASSVAILLATVGGGGAILAFLLTSQIRAWNRISIYLGFFAAIVLAVFLTLACRWLLAHRAPMFACGIGLAAVAIVGVLDQTTSPTIDYAGIRESWRSNARFVAAIGNRVSPGARILELPYVSFPENPPVANMADYDLMTPYLADRKDLKWSYGEVKGRPTDWADDLSRRPTRELVVGAAVAGFSGIYVDLDGYFDDGRQVSRQIEDVVGPGSEIQSSDGRAAFFDLRGLQAQLASQLSPAEREAIASFVLTPVALVPGKGFSPFDVTDDGRSSWGDRNGELEVENPGPSAAKAMITFRLAGPSESDPTSISIRCPGSRRVVKRVTSVQTSVVRIELSVPTGGASCKLSAEGPQGPVTREDPRPKFQLVQDPRVETAGSKALVSLATKRG